MVDTEESNFYFHLTQRAQWHSHYVGNLHKYCVGGMQNYTAWKCRMATVDINYILRL